MFRLWTAKQWGGRATFRAKFAKPKSAAVNLALVGVTRDSAGAPLGNCTVELYHGKRMIAGTVSDASGNFRFDNPGSGPFRIISDKAGVAGVTAETLTAV